MRRISLSQVAALLRTAPAALQTVAQIESIAFVTVPALHPETPGGFPTASPHRLLSTTAFAASAGDKNGTTDGTSFQDHDQIEVIASLIGSSQMLVSEGKLAEAGALLGRGAEQAEEALGSGSLYLSPLWNQLALIQFLEGRCDEAAAAGAKAFDIVRALAAQDGSPQARGAAAATAVRHASTLAGAGRAGEAAPQLAAAQSDLDAAIAAMTAVLADAETKHDESAAQDARQSLATFHAAAGEAAFYRNLCVLTALAEEATPADVERFTEGMVAGLDAMTASLGTKFPLTAAALREHSRVTIKAMTAGKGPLAEALTVQAVRLFEVYDPDGAETAGMWHQLGTLQHALGRHEAAVESLRRALQMMEGCSETVEGNALIVKQALVMALGAAGRHEEARGVVVAVAPALIDTLGAGNPLSMELDLTMTQMRLREVREEVAAGRLDAAEAAREEEQLLEQIATSAAALEPYVAEFKNRAGQLMEEAKGSGDGGVKPL